MTIWTIQSQFVKAQVQSLGGMLGPAWFRIGARSVQPFAVAPWGDDSGPEYLELPNILKRLRGEWACIPFGIEDESRPLPRDWLPVQPLVGVDPLPHGRSSNAEWQLADIWGDRLDLILTYPEPHAVRLVKRRVSASGREPRLNISLAIEVRRPCELPIGTRYRCRGIREPSRSVSYGSRIAAEAIIRRARASKRSRLSRFVPRSTSGHWFHGSGTIPSGGQGCLAR